MLLGCRKRYSAHPFNDFLSFFIFYSSLFFYSLLSPFPFPPHSTPVTSFFILFYFSLLLLLF
ncbi:hypothetical protein BCR41DRAFT_351153 [Lobosporangium transversale]|uniref:Uncharacterized protein n=1 Tax=Lobosporangium transversale TaxID=64571 RepID=A0A1Y2GSG1_9FUNG|nr:hypothetical protein BCR41DRAFT_351153 [Lobosporangium transversale]ORZ20031.1 hypothetical protein BCR41DRAFT_351153 [Lobosporangium transversale]|eukprot:XP_021882571.1 hypothetical protein BCR41DRAFT_351153 [Lobosporangium transversale]